jgi:hypothetical protein
VISHSFQEGAIFWTESVHGFYTPGGFLLKFLPPEFEGRLSRMEDAELNAGCAKDEIDRARRE